MHLVMTAKANQMMHVAKQDDDRNRSNVMLTAVYLQGSIGAEFIRAIGGFGRSLDNFRIL